MKQTCAWKLSSARTCNWTELACAFKPESGRIPIPPPGRLRTLIVGTLW